mmetsp:Transcript_27965/g.78352  ORF Transcript_27965/g.78352 Transcript_27965/m.78352 type:complete len:225 (-) Transcript_27965:773-1447(-)
MHNFINIHNADGRRDADVAARLQVVAQHDIAWLQQMTQMADAGKCDIVHPKVRFAGHLHIRQSVFGNAGSRSLVQLRCVIVIVTILNIIVRIFIAEFDVENDETHQPFCGEQNGVRLFTANLVVRLGTHIDLLHAPISRRRRIDHVDGGRNLRRQAQTASKFGIACGLVHDHQVVATYGHHVACDGVLDVGSIVARILRHQLLAGLDLHGRQPTQELSERLCLR